MFEIIPEEVLKAQKKVREAGFEAFLVGGCVRDILMGRTPSDYDMNTSAMPEEIHRIFGAERCVDTGIKHGTVTVITDGRNIEITTYRTDGKYSDSRHPDGVTLGVPLVEDLRRRDFTVNAMCWSPETGVIDAFGGQEDLKARVVRCVGDPDRRFGEDALRIMRAVRFASTLDGSIDPATEEAMERLAPTLDMVSPERKAVELTKLLGGAGAARIIQTYPDIIDRVVPGILRMRGYDQNNPYHAYTLLEHTARVVAGVPAEKTDRLAALLHDIAKPLCRTTDAEGISHYRGHPERGARIAEEILTGLRFDRATVNAVTELVAHHGDYVERISRAGIRRMLGRLGPTQFFRLMTLKKADNMAKGTDLGTRVRELEAIESAAREILARGECLSLSGLAIGGSDLQALGMRPGPRMGRVLQRLLDAVQEERLPNDRESLIAAAREMISARESAEQGVDS